MNKALTSNQPLVSIITPTYNQGQFIEATIKSVLAQTYPNIEYILIDALSTDQTEEIVESYRDQISLVIREADKGQSDAIVKGFKLAKGELVGWINSDDLLYPDCVERMVAAALAHPEAVLFVDSNIDIIDESGALIEQMNVPLISREHLLRENNRLIQPGAFFRRDALARVDYLDVNLRFSMDLDLWLRLLTLGDFVDVAGNPVAGYREWGETKTSTGGERLAIERIAILLRHGAADSDRSIVELRKQIRRNKLLKPIRKSISYAQSLMRILLLASYYGFARYLPVSSTRYTRFARTIREKICRRLFLRSGININVERGAVFGTGRKIVVGNNSGLGVNSKLMGRVIIGSNVMMGPDALFVTTTHKFEDVKQPMIEQGFSPEKPIFISDDVWIGARCTFLPGVRVGKGAIIGAGSVVTKSVPEYAVVAGNPARIVKSRLNS